MTTGQTESAEPDGHSRHGLREERLLGDLDASLPVQLGLLAPGILYTLYFARFLLVPRSGRRW